MTSSKPSATKSRRRSPALKTSSNDVRSSWRAWSTARPHTVPHRTMARTSQTQPEHSAKSLLPSQRQEGRKPSRKSEERRRPEDRQHKLRLSRRMQQLLKFLSVRDPAPASVGSSAKAGKVAPQHLPGHSCFWGAL